MYKEKQKILSVTTDRREYKRLINYQDPWDDMERYMISTAKRGYAGYWTRRGLYPSQIRMYRTWKHNRSTQYKEQSRTDVELH